MSWAHLNALRPADIWRQLFDGSLPGLSIVPDPAEPERSVFRIVLQTSSWVPTGLVLSGHPETREALEAIAGYPVLTETFPVPDAGHDGLQALAQCADSLSAMVHALEERQAVIGREVAQIKAAMEEKDAKPWYITGFDPYQQTVSIGGERMLVSTGRPSGSCEDMRTIFLRPFFPVRKRALHVVVEGVDRGTRVIRLRVGKGTSRRTQIDLGQPLR